jgi:hypothetical protein
MPWPGGAANEVRVGCGEQLTTSRMRAHFTLCPERPSALESCEAGPLPKGREALRDRRGGREIKSFGDLRFNFRSSALQLKCMATVIAPS